MNRFGAVLTAACVLAAPSIVAMAHHSQAMFADTPLWITGTVLRFRAVDPHVMIELRETGSDGVTRKWIIEGPRRGRLDTILQNQGGITADKMPREGDRISVCGFPLTKDFSPDRMYRDWQPERGRFVHGEVLVLADGLMHAWGPYGTLDKCLREGDDTGDWIAFLNRDPLAHRQWCDAFARRRPDRPDSRPVVKAVNSGLSTPCAR